MVLMNYVVLEQGVPKRLHFDNHAWMDRTIFDKVLQAEKPVRSLIMVVDREDGEVVLKTLSVLSNRLASQLLPYLRGSAFRSYEFTITKLGAGFDTTYSLEAKPIGPEFV